MKFKHPKKIKRTLAGLLTGIVMTLLLLLIPSSILTRAEYIFYDGFSKHESDKASLHSDDIFIVDIDENALLKYGPYNEWTRETHAKAVEKLEEGGAAAIAFDILFKTADFGTRNAVRTEKVLPFCSGTSLPIKSGSGFPARSWSRPIHRPRFSGTLHRMKM